MPETEIPRFGTLPPKHNFVMNPYHDIKIKKCPYCEYKTGTIKIPLMIHIKPVYWLSLNQSCRYCSKCDLLIANKLDVEHSLTEMFRENNPEIIGNEYYVIGTVEKTAWQKGMKNAKHGQDIMSHTNDFIKHYPDLRATKPGWYAPGQKPQTKEPSESMEWIRINETLPL